MKATSSAVELTAALRSKEISACELLECYLDRIDRLDRDAVNAVVTLDVERAGKAAKAADDALARGEAIGPLHGLPITIKDAIATEGIRSTGGAVELENNVPAADAPAVARLKAAGAIVFGKTNLPRSVRRRGRRVTSSSAPRATRGRPHTCPAAPPEARPPRSPRA